MVALLLLAASPLQAQPYPSKPVRIITQAAAGSGPDVIGRIVADHLTRRWGQPALIINHPGAGGSIAAKAAALSEPDGYTLYMASGSALMVLPETHANLPFDFDRDFIPIGMVGRQPMLIAVSPTLDVSSLPDLIALAKRRPGEILFAGNTRGALPHLTGEMFRQRSGADLTFVPYPGSAAAFHDLLGGRISMIVEGVSGLAATSRSARSSCSRSQSPQRLPQFPNAPTVAETLPGFEATGWFALSTRTGTPDAIVEKVSRDLRAALADPELQERFAKLGTEATPMSPTELRAFMQSEQKMWKPVIKQAGLKSN